MNKPQREFLDRATAEAVRANHPFAQMAASEAALESNWGNSELALDANNLFGMKQHAHPVCGTINLPTKEFLDGKWIPCTSQWVNYPDWRACFADRLATLERLSNAYPHYKAAIEAKDAETFVRQVSLTWSTDPAWVCSCGKEFIDQKIAFAHVAPGHVTRVVPGLARALKALSIYREYTAV